MIFDANYREDVTLADGSRIRLRAVTPADGQKLAEGFSRLSAESRYRRFFATKARLTDTELRFLTTPDGVDHVAIGAVEIGEGGEEGDGVGIGHLVRVAGRCEVAELALTVLDARQGLGLGRMLMERLIAAAAEREVRCIRFHLLAENERMRGLIQNSFRNATFTREGEMMTGEFPVPATTEPAHVARDAAAAPLFGLLRLIAAGSVMPLNFALAGMRYGASSMAPYNRSPKPAANDDTNDNS